MTQGKIPATEIWSVEVSVQDNELANGNLNEPVREGWELLQIPTGRIY